MTQLLLLDALLRGAATALALLIGQRCLAVRDHAPRLAPLAAALMLGLAVQVLGAHPLLDSELPRAAVAAIVGVSVANAVLFAALAWVLFEPAYRPGQGLFAAWLAAAALGAFNVWQGCQPLSAPWAQWSLGLQRSLPVAGALMALAAALHDWRGDLLESRRRLRLRLVLTGALYSLWQLGLRLDEPGGRLSGLPSLLDAGALLAVLILVLPVVLDRGTALDQLGVATPTPTPTPSTPSAPDAPLAPEATASPRLTELTSPSDRLDPDDLLVAARLQAAITQGLHREADLSIGGLAEQLRCPEYRLRRVIRSQGHAHFNQFLHTHRLADAQAALADPRRRDESVLSIALSVGYASIGPFNRAFKAASGQTPSTWRQARLPDS